MTEGAQSTASEEDNPFQLFVEKEIVKVPDGAIVTEWIRANVRVVGVDVTVQQGDLIVEGDPEFVMYLAILTRS